jgi:hypothetical protein
MLTRPRDGILCQRLGSGRLHGPGYSRRTSTQSDSSRAGSAILGTLSLCVEFGTSISHHVYRDRYAAQFFLRRSDTKDGACGITLCFLQGVRMCIRILWAPPIAVHLFSHALLTRYAFGDDTIGSRPGGSISAVTRTSGQRPFGGAGL